MLVTCSDSGMVLSVGGLAERERMWSVQLGDPKISSQCRVLSERRYKGDSPSLF